MSEVQRVKELGEQIGYGHLMMLASALWRKSLKDKGYPIEGAFSPTCLTFIDKELVKKTKVDRDNYDLIVGKLTH